MGVCLGKRNAMQYPISQNALSYFDMGGRYFSKRSRRNVTPMWMKKRKRRAKRRLTGK
jgi:hypothetical protein